MTDFPTDGHVAVLGATGGIGAAVLARLAGDGRFATASGFSRAGRPALELTDEASIASVAEILRGKGEIRLVVDATGFLSDATQAPEKSWRQLDAAALARNFAINAIGPALLMKHLLPLLPRRGKAVFATLSARVGGIGENSLGGWYGYRAAKAALNQLVRTAAVELARSRPDAVCVALHPGTTETRLSAPFGKAGLDVRPPDVAARDLLAVIDDLGPGDSGGFFDQNGAPIPW